MEKLGSYEYNPKDLIGHGAFAVVFKGRLRQDHDRVVAIKSITKKSLAKSQNLLGKEILVLKELTELNHENVVALLDCQESNNNVFLVMEYCNGGDLADYLNGKGTLSEDTIRLFLTQLADALAALHNKGVIHRDLKPQNILLAHSDTKTCPQPSEIKLKIADFGFARFLNDGVMAATLCGSPMYMAPEVIMSKQYDARADLWSLGTIVYQCLTGRAPFQAQTPQALKQFYEKSKFLCPKIPVGTSPELEHIILGLLKKDVETRIPINDICVHPFLQRADSKPLSSPLSDLPPTLNMQGSPPITKGFGIPLAPISIQDSSQMESPSSTRDIASGSSPEMTDDFVLVPSDLPTDPSAEPEPICDKILRYRPINCPSPPRRLSTGKLVSLSNQSNNIPVPAVRPGSLQMSEPIPVPTMRTAYAKMRNKEYPSDQVISEESEVKENCVLIPRSAPINMKRSDRHNHPDISSLSPPSVLFTLGTPPGGRRRSTNSLSETPPPPNVWQVSPVTGTRHTPTGSPLRRSGSCANSPILTGTLALLAQQMNSPTNNLLDNNNIRNSPIVPFLGSRALTLPEIAEAGSYHNAHDMSEQDMSNLFHPPELPEETILDKEHNEILAKLNFTLALSDCVLSLAELRTSPFGAAESDTDITVSVTEQIGVDMNTVRRIEQIVLLIRAMQYLSQGLSLASESLKSEKLSPSATVKYVVKTLNKKFRTTISQCRKLNATNLLQRAERATISADYLLYNHALKMCQQAAMEELFGTTTELCFSRYQTAQIILHSLASQTSIETDREVLQQYKDAVEKRLYVLKEQAKLNIITNDQS